MTLIDNNSSAIETERNLKDSAFSKVVKIALVLNFAMFFVELFCGIYADSLALIADSFDFLGDSLNYLIAIYVLKKSPKIQSYSAIIKASSMLLFGLYISFSVVHKALTIQILPQSNMMIAIAFLALLVNLGVSVLLFKFRNGSSNQKSVWLCSRNDAINNLLVIIAGFLIAYFSQQWPDLLVAGIMALLAIFSSVSIFRAAKNELKHN